MEKEATEDRIVELEHKLSIAIEALDVATKYSMLDRDRKIITEAIAQIEDLICPK